MMKTIFAKSQSVAITILLLASNAQASNLDSITEFSDYLKAGAPALAVPESGRANLETPSKTPLFEVELEVGKATPTEYLVRAPSVTGSQISTRTARSDLPAFRVGLGVRISSSLSARLSYSHLEQSTEIIAASNTSFNSQIFTLGQTYSLKSRVNTARLLLVYQLLSPGRLHFDLGAGLMNVDHQATVSITGTSATASKNIFLPNLYTQVRFDIVGPWFLSGDLSGYFFDSESSQVDGSTGIGLAFERTTLRLGSRWQKSRLTKTDLESELSAQSFFVSVMVGI